jgi:hypothetical protein
MTIATLLCHAALADDDFHTAIGGFGTIGGTYSGDSGFTYIHNASEFKATNSQFDLGLDSRIGVQATFSYGTDLSVIVQEEAKRRGSENLSPATEWAFLQYAPDSDLKFRFGRVALATFLMSDSRDVGYAQTWFHAPNEVYGSEPFETLDGAQALGHVDLGNFGVDLVGGYGTTSQTEGGPAGPVVVSAKYAYNLSAAVSYGNASIRVADTFVSAPLELPRGLGLLSNYENADQFLSAGLQYDDGRAIVLSEFAKRTMTKAPVVNLPFLASDQWYVAGGWRVDKLTPMLIYGNWDAGRSLVGTPHSDASWSASLRYDAVANVALKAQLSRPEKSSQFFWASSDSPSVQRVNVFSFGADFVF